MASVEDKFPDEYRHSMDARECFAKVVREVTLICKTYGYDIDVTGIKEALTDEIHKFAGAALIETGMVLSDAE